ncbi:MAG: monovalent cation:proton antiporter family protein [Bacteroidota bacterium]
MKWFTELVIFLAGFSLVAVASGQISRLFRKIRLPMITGLILIGIISGPWGLGLLTGEAVSALSFLNDLALAFIALAVGSELYIKDIRERVKSITWMTITQLLVTFLIGTIAFYLLSDLVPFLKDMNEVSRLAVALLGGIIFAARSPASAIAIINEMRARGPFTRTSIGVIVVKDFLVVLLFSLILTLSRSILESEVFTFMTFLIAIIEILAALGIGYLFARLIVLFFKASGNQYVRTILILTTGFLVFAFTRWLGKITPGLLGTPLHIEPLAISIFGGYIVTNYSRFRNDFIKVIQDTSPVIYIIFFTLIGAGINISVLGSIWYIAVILYFIRIIALMIAGYSGALLGGDSPKTGRISWMAYVTQAGVSIALVSAVAAEFPGWGREFSTLMIAIIILNLVTGPPLFKQALQLSGEGKLRSDSSFLGREQRAVIFGLESQSVALAKRLSEYDWNVSIVYCSDQDADTKEKAFRLLQIPGIDIGQLKAADVHHADTVICLLSDEENLKVASLIRGNFNVRHIIVRLNERKNYEQFSRLKVMVMDPATAMLSLLEHYARAPMATSLLLGMDKGQDTMDIQLANPALHGVTLRDLQLPMDVIVLSVSRRDQIIISHGYTRLRLGDVITMVGSTASLEQIAVRFRS